MRRVLLQAGVAFALLLAFALVTVDAEAQGWLARYGHQLTRSLPGDRSDALVNAMYVITAFGGGFALSGIALLAGLAFAYWQRNWTPLLILAVVLGGIKALGSTTKWITSRLRPPSDVAVYVEPSYAYPSGHASATTAVCVTLAVLVTAAARYRGGFRSASAVSTVWAVWVVAVTSSAAMGVSRVVLGVHWPTDVLGGWLLGGGWALLCLAAIRAICLRYGAAFPPQLRLPRRLRVRAAGVRPR